MQVTCDPRKRDSIIDHLIDLVVCFAQCPWMRNNAVWFRQFPFSCVYPPRLKNKQPGMPVGCLVEHINAAALIDGVSHIVYAKEPKSEFAKFKILMEESLPERSSSKHLSGLDLGRMEPTPALLP